MTLREINATIRKGVYVYILERGVTPHRITRAKTIRGALWVRVLASGGWIPVDVTDRIETR